MGRGFWSPKDEEPSRLGELRRGTDVRPCAVPVAAAQRGPSHPRAFISRFFLVLPYADLVLDCRSSSRGEGPDWGEKTCKIRSDIRGLAGAQGVTAGLSSVSIARAGEARAPGSGVTMQNSSFQTCNPL